MAEIVAGEGSGIKVEFSDGTFCREEAAWRWWRNCFDESNAWEEIRKGTRNVTVR